MHYQVCIRLADDNGYKFDEIVMMMQMKKMLMMKMIVM